MIPKRSMSIVAAETFNQMGKLVNLARRFGPV